jgi:hypothetical protein
LGDNPKRKDDSATSLDFHRERLLD